MVNGINMSSEKQLLEVGIMKWNYGLLRREKGKGKGCDNCYSALLYLRHSHENNVFFSWADLNDQP